MVQVSWGTNQEINIHDNQKCLDSFFKGTTAGRLIADSHNLAITKI